MRGLAIRLGVVPGALYRHVHGKDQLGDLVVDGVLAEVDCQVDQNAPLDRAGDVCWPADCGRSWSATRASRGCSRPAIRSGRTLWPWRKHSLKPCSRPAWLTAQTALAFSLIYDYAVGFALSDRSTVNEQRVQDPATRLRLHTSSDRCPPASFPRWWPSVNTSGPIIATSDSQRISRRCSTGSKRPGAGWPVMPDASGRGWAAIPRWHAGQCTVEATARLAASADATGLAVAALDPGAHSSSAINVPSGVPGANQRQRRLAASPAAVNRRRLRAGRPGRQRVCRAFKTGQGCRTASSPHALLHAGRSL